MNSATILGMILEEMKLLRAEVIDIRVELAAARYANYKASQAYDEAKWAASRPEEFDSDSKRILDEDEDEDAPSSHVVMPIAKLIRESENVRKNRR